LHIAQNASAVSGPKTAGRFDLFASYLAVSWPDGLECDQRSTSPCLRGEAWARSARGACRGRDGGCLSDSGFRATTAGCRQDKQGEFG
jgi:hypothetical protein